jgi:hypothetical protein
VDRVTTNSLGERILTLVGFTEDRPDKLGLREVRCTLRPDQRERARDLSRGQKVRLLGRCDGEVSSFEISIIDLADGEVEWVGPDPAIPVTAMELTRSYAEDRPEAERKYNGRQLVIEGVFQELRDDLHRPVVVIAGYNEQTQHPVRILAAFRPDQRAAFDKVTKGQTIRIKGECNGKDDDEISVSFATLLSQ